MVISRTPLRISFAGGGSDLAVHYRKQPGAIIGTTIDKYIYVTVNSKFDDAIRVSYSKTEEVSHVDHLEHPLIRECLRYLQIQGGVEITSIADVPSKGTGLGSSSSFTVGLLHALHAHFGRYVSAEKLGKDSCYLEIERCREPIGKQDQYAAAFGGLNFIEFKEDDTVNVSPILCAPQTVKTIEQNILLFYTGITRSASKLLQDQSTLLQTCQKKQDVLQKMVRLAYDLRDELQRDHHDSFGPILHENWMLKKTLTDGISTPEFDSWYDAALKAGATGGKILGAGGGGFLMIYAPYEKHAHVINALPMLKKVPVSFERVGSKIIFYQ